MDDGSLVKEFADAAIEVALITVVEDVVNKDDRFIVKEVVVLFLI